MAGFRKAVPEKTPLKLAIYGQIGTGKTLTALLFAEGLSKLTGKRINMIDTEKGTKFYDQAILERDVHPEAFDFDRLHTRSLAEAHETFRNYGTAAAVWIVDSMTQLWEAAQASGYTGDLTSIGSVPLGAWTKIKRPYKSFMDFLIEAPQHTILCGRENTLWEEDPAGGERKATGTKMDAEKNTGYEPDFTIRMERIREPGNRKNKVAAFIEKDRTGVLTGHVIVNPTFENVIAKWIPYLANVETNYQTGDVAKALDIEHQTEEEARLKETSQKHFKQLRARLDQCEDRATLEIIKKEITPAIKKEMTATDIAELRKLYLETEAKYPKGK